MRSLDRSSLRLLLKLANDLKRASARDVLANVGKIVLYGAPIAAFGVAAGLFVKEFIKDTIKEKKRKKERPKEIKTIEDWIRSVDYIGYPKLPTVEATKEFLEKADALYAEIEKKYTQKGKK